MSTSIDFNEDGSCWAEIKAGRKRWFPKNHAVTKAARSGLKLDLGCKQKEVTRRVVYRDQEGKLGVPMTPDMIPEGCERIEITSLAQEDALAKEMRKDLEKRFADDRQVTDYLDQVFADENGVTPREVILRSDAYRTDFGREICQEMAKALEQEERNREKVDVNFFFHTREYDR